MNFEDPIQWQRREDGRGWERVPPPAPPVYTPESRAIEEPVWVISCKMTANCPYANTPKCRPVGGFLITHPASCPKEVE